MEDTVIARIKAKRKTTAPKVRSNGISRVRQMLSGTPRALGVRLISVTKKKVVAEMRIKALHINLNGSVNGGVIMAFADIVGAAGTVMNLPPGYRTATLESKTNFFAAGMRAGD